MVPVLQNGSPWCQQQLWQASYTYGGERKSLEQKPMCREDPEGEGMSNFPDSVAFWFPWQPHLPCTLHQFGLMAHPFILEHSLVCLCALVESMLWASITKSGVQHEIWATPPWSWLSGSPASTELLPWPWHKALISNVIVWVDFCSWQINRQLKSPLTGLVAATLICGKRQRSPKLRRGQLHF